MYKVCIKFLQIDSWPYVKMTMLFAMKNTGIGIKHNYCHIYFGNFVLTFIKFHV